MVVAEILSVLAAVAITSRILYHHCKNRRAMDWSAAQWSNTATDAWGNSGKIALLRLAMSAYAFVTIGITTSSPTRHRDGGPVLGGPYVLCTFTFWSWTLIAVYLCLVGLASTLHWAGLKNCDGKWTQVFCAAMWVLFQTMFSCAILVFLVVWLVLLPFAEIMYHTDGGMLSWTVLSAHNLNIVFMSVECAFNNMRFNPNHFVFPMYYGLMYVAFSWAWYFHAGVFYYFFIDWRDPLTPIFYLVLIGVILGAFRAGIGLSNYMKVSTPTASSLPLSNPSAA